VINLFVAFQLTKISAAPVYLRTSPCGQTQKFDRLKPFFCFCKCGPKRTGVITALFNHCPWWGRTTRIPVFTNRRREGFRNRPVKITPTGDNNHTTLTLAVGCSGFTNSLSLRSRYWVRDRIYKGTPGWLRQPQLATDSANNIGQSFLIFFCFINRSAG